MSEFQQGSIAESFVFNDFMKYDEEAAIREHNELVLERWYDKFNSEVMTEEAKFSFLPRFKEKKELKRVYLAIEDAEDLLNSNGMEKGSKAGKIALRILDIYCNIVDVLMFPTLIMIFPIIGYLMDRLIEWAVQAGKEAVAKGDIDKTILKMEKLRDLSKGDKKMREACDQQIKKLKQRKDELIMS